ncbi:hypothetical protein Trydic_g23307 [Trypoxylus dichotomus]
MVKLKNLKVAFVHPDLGIGGAERLVLDIAIALSQQGMEVMFLTNHFDKTHAFEELKDGKYQVRVIGDWIPRSIFGVCQALCAYIRIIYLSLVYIFFLKRSEQVDVYIVDQIPMAVPFLKWTNCKVIYYCHHPDLLASPPGGFLKKIYRKPIDWLEMSGTRKSDVILVNSKYTAEVFSATFPQIKHELQILYPTISNAYQNTVKHTERKEIKNIIPELEGNCSDVFFLSINRFHPAKKLELAIQSMLSLQKQLSSNEFERVHLILAGGYDPNNPANAVYFNELVLLCQNENLTTKVTFLKSPSDKLKAELLVSCSALLYTPVNEHFGIVPLEAMAAGKPVIACNSGGPKETVEHNVTGFLCDPSGDSYSEFMVKLMDDQVCLKMGLKGKERLEKLFTYKTFSDKIMNIVTGTVCNN